MNEPTRHTNPAPGRTRRSGSLRYLLIALALVLVIGTVAVAAAPALLSTNWGKDAALGWVNGAIPGEITADDVSLSWLGGQSVDSLAISDAAGRPVLKLAKFTTGLTLLDALRRRLSLGQTVFQGLEADLKFDSEGTNNLARALGSEPGAAGEGGGGVVVPVTGNMALIDSRVSIAAPGIDPVVLDNLSGAVEMTGPDAPIKLSLGGRSRQGELSGSITVNGQVEHLIRDGRFDPAGARANLRASIQDLPVDALDQVLSMRGVLSAALGDRTTVNIEAGGDASHQSLSLDANAPRGKLSLEGAVDAGRFSLTRPANLDLSIAPALVEAVKRLSSNESTLALSESVPVQLTIEQLTFPLKDFDPAALAVRAGLDARQPIRFTGVRDVGEAAINALHMVIDSPGLGDRVRVTLDGKPVTGGKSGTLSVDAEIGNLLDDQGAFQPNAITVRAKSRATGIPTTLIDTTLHQNGLLLEALGPTVALNLDADTQKPGHTDVSLSVDTAHLRTGPVKLSVDDAVTLSEPARIELDLTPGLWRRFTGEAGGPQAEGTSRWTLDITAFHMPVPAGEGPVFQPARSALHATLSTPSVAMRTAADAPALGLKNLSLQVAADKLDDIGIDLSGVLTQAGGTLAALDASPISVMLNARTGLEPDASVKTVTSTVKLDSAGLKGVLKTSIEKGFTRLVLTEPAVIDAAITPALFESKPGGDAPGVTLRDAAKAHAVLKRLSVPLAPFDLTGLTAQGELETDALAFQTAGGISSTIERSTTAFEFDGADGGRAKLDLNGRVTTGPNETGDLAVAAVATNLTNPKGEFSTDNLSLDLDGQLQHLPSALLDRLLGMDGTLTATLGPTSDVTMQTRLDKLQGPLSLNLDAANAQADIKARIGDGVLTLAEPLSARFEPTPEFGQKVLAKLHPIFETTQRAEQPIKLDIPADGVRIPVRDFQLAGIVIPDMTLDFGRIILKSGWLLRGIVGLGQQFGGMKNVQREEWVAWFTPGVLEMRDGRVVYKRRLDLLLDQRLHLATWGDADIAGDRANLTLAFMPETMKRVFRITVAANDALRMPIKGPLSGPSVDFQKTAADLARLRAQEEVSGKNPLAGLVLGSVAGKVTGGGAIPPPSVSPLPWADLLRQQEAADQQPAGTGEPTQSEPVTQETEPQQPATQSAPEEKPSTEEQVIKGLIDIFGKKKNKGD